MQNIRFHRLFNALAFAAALHIGMPSHAVAQTANGRATTAAPTYANGTAAPLSLDLSGNLRTNLSGTGTTASQVQGNVAHDAVDAGNPVKMGGFASSTMPANVGDGDRVNLWLNPNGSLVYGGSIFIGADGQSNSIGRLIRGDVTATAGMLGTWPFVFNGTTWDRQRGDTTGTYAVGNVASGVTDAGNPVKVGAVFNSTLPSFTTGQRADLQTDVRGNLRTLTVGVSGASADGRSNTDIGWMLDNTSSGGSLRPLSSAPLYFNGTTWDRTRGDTNGAYAQGNVASGVADAGNPVKIGGRYNSTLPTLTDGQRGDLQLGTRGSLNVTLFGPNSATPVASAAPADSASGVTGLATYTQNSVYNGTNWDRSRGDANGGTWVQPSTNSGTSNFSLIAANSTNSTNVKNAPGVITEISVYNNSATIGYLKLYNSASAPTCGSGTPVGRYMIPASTSGAGSNVNIPLGKAFSTGIGFCITAAIGDSDTTAVAANAYIVNMTYK